MASCQWRACDQSAKLAVLVGWEWEQAVPEGLYCVGHAAIACGDLREGRDEPTWIDWANRRPRLQLVGDDGGMIAAHQQRGA